MPQRQTTGLAGEYYFSYRAAMRGYHVALARGNAVNVDVLISSEDGAKLVSVQVKSMKDAWRTYSPVPEKNHWEWEVNLVRHPNAASLVFAFVHLKAGDDKVFIVPPSVVHECVRQVENPRPFFWIYHAEPSVRAARLYCNQCTRALYVDNWQLIDQKLS